MKATLAVAGAAFAALVSSLVLAGTAAASGTILTIPDGDTATLSGAQFGGSDNCPSDNLTYGYTLNGGSLVPVATGGAAGASAGCNPAAGATIGPVAGATTLTIYVTDNTCTNATYDSDGGGAADHALVTPEGDAGTTWGVSIMDCDVGSETDTQRLPDENGDGNFNVTVTISAPPEYMGGAQLTGDAVEDATLTADAGTWTGTPAPTFSYEWERCKSGTCTDIIYGPMRSADTSSSTYQTTSADVGYSIEVVISATNGVPGGSGAQTEGPLGPIGSPPVNNPSTPPSIPGTPSVGQPLTAAPGGWSGYPAPAFSNYDWYTCTSEDVCTSVQNSASDQYTPVSGDEGLTLEVVVTATNGYPPDGTAMSAQTSAVTAAPANTSTLPSISSSTPNVGDQLTADPGSWSGYPAPTFSNYDWYHCTSEDVCTSVQNGPSDQYTPVVGDEGLTLEVVVTATNGTPPDGTATSAQTDAVTGAPVNTSTPPSISSSTPNVGDQLTAAPGSWSGYPAPAFTYTWNACTDAGATNCHTVQAASSKNQYTPSPADAGLFIQVLVSASNSVGSAGPVTSATTAAVTQSPGNTPAPSITGTAQQGVPLSGAAGTWTGLPTPTLSYQWQDCDSSGNGCVSVATGGHALAYTPTSADVGHTLVLSVTGTNSAGTLTVASARTAPVLPAPPSNDTAPTITGAATAQQAVQLTATNGTWENSPSSFTYQWERCDASGNNCQSLGTAATSQSYTPVPADVGLTLRVIVTAHNTGGTGSTPSAQTAAVLIGVPVITVVPAISGSAQAGQTLSATFGSWNNSPTNYVYQWALCDFSGANCSDIKNANANPNQYLLLDTEIGDTLRVTVTASNAGGHAAATSDASEPVSIAAPANSTLPSIAGTVQQGQTLSTTQGVWSNSPDSYAYQWEQCDASGAACAPILTAGASSSYVPTSGDVGHTLRVIVTAHNSSGDTPATSAQTVVVLIAAPGNTGSPQLSGTAQQGETLNGATGTWQNSPTTYTYQWEQCDASGNACMPILGADTINYSPVITDVGHTLRVIVTATNAGGTTTATSGPSAVVEGLEASVPPPIFQQSADLSNVTGTILIKLPGSNTFVPLTGPIDVPDGSTIDATQGTVSLTTQLPNGTYQTGQFYSGQFTVEQAKKGTVEAELSGGSFSGCKAGKKHGARAAAGSHKKPGTVVRQLWGNAHGDYTTKGKYGSASVSGTVWLTQDRCDGTFFKALKDDIYVVAFAHPHKRHHVKQGQTFFIPAP